MKLLPGVVIALLLLSPPRAGAEAADDEYVGIYNLIQQADALNENGQLAAALRRYAQAQGDLKRFQDANPDWNVKVVSFRQRYLAAKIALISSELPAGGAGTGNPGGVGSAAPTPPVVRPATQAMPALAAASASVVSHSDEVIRDLQAQLRQEEADRALLQAKLKEALSARPAAVDPQEFDQAQAQIVALEKENDLLKVSLEQSRVAQSKTEAVKVQRELAEAKRHAAVLAGANAVLIAENVRLHAQVKQIAVPDADTAALREENALLKKQVAELKSPASAGDLELKLQAAQAQVAALESDKEVLGLENTALEMRVKQAQGVALGTMAAKSDDAGAARIRELEAERDALQARLDIAMSAIGGSKSKKESARLAEANRQLDAIQARVDILEAHAVPYTQDELALLSESKGTTLVAAAHHSGRRSPKELSAASIALLADAKKDVANEDFAAAEEKYLEILKTNEKNPAVLTDLASIQVNLNHAADAEEHIKAALAVDPDNDYTLFVLGRLKLAQRKYDDALDALSRAAQVNPEDAEIQNNLGVALSQKGLRVPAEAALRKAVQIDPGCADAHANLAFVYITQRPPLVELARWHYEKALAAGHAHNPAIEKLIGQPEAPGNSQ